MTKKFPPFAVGASTIALATIISLCVTTDGITPTHGSLWFFKLYQDAVVWAIVNTAIVCLWRGTWGLMDIFIYPENLAKSYTVSVALGLSLLALAYSLGKTNICL